MSGTSVTTPYAYDDHDHLLSAGSASYSYNADGDCVRIVNNGAVTTLRYDVLNRVTGITLPNGTVNSYQYNGNWQRVEETMAARCRMSCTRAAAPAAPCWRTGVRHTPLA